MNSNQLKNCKDEELMVQVMDHHSHPAIEELHKRYAQKLLGFCIKMTNRNIEQAQDIVQDVFLKVLEKKHLFDPTKKFYTWIFTITSNHCKSSFRNQYRNTALTEYNNSGSFSENELEKVEFMKALEASLNRLEIDQKECYVLRFLEQFSVQEIADITQTNIGTVKSRLFYAGKKITKEMAEFNPKFETELFKLN